MASPRVLVTGGAGFIGSHLVDRLVQETCRVTVLDNLSTGRIGNIDGPVVDGTVRLVEGSVLDPAKVATAVARVDVVVHLAAVVSVPLSLVDPATTFDVNVAGTRQVLDRCLADGVKKFILISSCAVYGEPRYTPVDELHPTSPLSPYAESKLEAERLFLKDVVTGLDAVVLRLFNVYGPRQPRSDYAGVISAFADQLKAGSPLTIHGDGLQTRDFVHVSDVVEAVWLALNARGVWGVFNVSSGKAVRILELAELMAELVGRDRPTMVFDEPREGDIRHSQGDFSKAKDVFGYQPRTELRQGLKALLDDVTGEERSRAERP